MSTTTTKYNREQFVDMAMGLALDRWEKTSLPLPDDTLQQLLRIALLGNTQKRKPRLLANPPSWCGYVQRDKSIDYAARDQCLANTLGKMLQWHRSSGYLGTIINADFQARSLEESYDAPGLRDALETFAILLIGPDNCRAVDRWKRALGR